MVFIRPWLAVALLLSGILATALPFTPTATAGCHCTFIGCMEYPVKDDDDEERDTNNNGKVDGDEMPLCEYILGVVADVLDGLTPDARLVAMVGADEVSVDASGNATLQRGEAGHLSFVVDLHPGSVGNLTGNVSLTATTGIEFSSMTRSFDTASDPVADFGFELAGSAPATINIPYTVRPDGFPAQTGLISFSTAASSASGTTVTSTSTVTSVVTVEADDDSPIPSAGLLLVFAALAVVAAVLRRR